MKLKLHLKALGLGYLAIVAIGSVGLFLWWVGSATIGSLIDWLVSINFDFVRVGVFVSTIGMMGFLGYPIGRMILEEFDIYQATKKATEDAEHREGGT